MSVIVLLLDEVFIIEIPHNNNLQKNLKCCYLNKYCCFILLN